MDRATVAQGKRLGSLPVLMTGDTPSSAHRASVCSALERRSDGLATAVATFLEDQSTAFEAAAELLAATVARGGTLFLCGNGGSAAHALHLEAELLGRFDRTRRSLPSVYLGMGHSTSTAIANDFGVAEMFARPLEALGRSSDALLAFSTSGTSPNVLRALEVARQKGLPTVLLTGAGGPDAADVVLRFPADGPDRVQEGHQLIVHALMDGLESAL